MGSGRPPNTTHTSQSVSQIIRTAVRFYDMIPLSKQANTQKGGQHWRSTLRTECKELSNPASKPSIRNCPAYELTLPFAEKATQIPKVASIKTPCRCFTASPIPSRCRRKVQGVSRAISTLWYRHSRVSGGKTPRAATSIMYARTISTLSRASACPISSLAIVSGRGRSLTTSHLRTIPMTMLLAFVI